MEPHGGSLAVVAILSIGSPAPLAERVTLEELPSRIRSSVSRGEPVLLVGEGVWSLWRDLVEWMESNNLNHLLLEMMDPREARVARIPYERLLGARIMLASQEYRATAPRVERNSRAIHLDAVFIARPEMCNNLGCPQCRCPSGALTGRPPSLEPVLCTGCGFCLSTCPHRAIWKHSASPEKLWDYIRYTVTRPTSGFLVYACRDSIAGLVEHLAGRAEHPVLIAPVTCPGDATLELLVAPHLLGLRPVVYCPKAAESCGKRHTREYIEWVLASYSRIAGEPLVASKPSEILEAEPGKPLLSEKEEVPVDLGYAARLAASRLLSGSEPPITPLPLTALHIVDHEKCDLCGACIVKCPHHALSAEARGDKQLLVLDPGKCTGCSACEKACPNDALVVKPSAPTSLGKKVLHEEEIVRCIACGKPIGSKKMVKRVVAQLRARGFKGNIIKMVYLCDDCKRKATLGLIKLDQLRVPEEE